MTLTNRAKQHHDTWKNACAAQQLLTPGEEKTLAEWAEHHGAMGLPYSPAELHAQASAISGKRIGQRWHMKFETCHSQLCAVKPAKLDPKHTKNFNETVINDYFDKLEDLHARYYGGIPSEHI